MAPRVEESCHARRERARLAGAGTRNDHERTVAMDYRGQLSLVQISIPARFVVHMFDVIAASASRGESHLQSGPGQYRHMGGAGAQDQVAKVMSSRTAPNCR